MTVRVQGMVPVESEEGLSRSHTVAEEQLVAQEMQLLSQIHQLHDAMIRMNILLVITATVSIVVTIAATEICFDNVLLRSVRNALTCTFGVCVYMRVWHV